MEDQNLRPIAPQPYTFPLHHINDKTERVKRPFKRLPNNSGNKKGIFD